ncbi:glycosyltransferase [Paenibacillus gallinarum]|uniref:Glycosyltransferase n=1 Tax=Paenibacillus gallinarum TaxID=2762232 RepID=A0ABR8SYS9_9BACL|nr:glycosyltransferase [Paenibacillus gallinarum]MBD7968550.1 glycosyltransferase [Paenibacillus gallinarum]
MEAIRLLMIIDKFEVGGTETYVSAVVEELLRRKIAVYVAGKPGNLLSKFKAIGCPTFTNIRNQEKFERWIVKHKINMINAHHETTGTLGSQLSKKLKIPFIFTIHGTYYPRSLINRVMKKCDERKAVISVSFPVKKWLEEKNISSIVIPNGINTEQFIYSKNRELLKQLGIPRKSRVLLYVSRLEDEKGDVCKDFIRAAQRFMDKEADVQVVIVGGGPDLNSVQKLAAKKHAQRIHILGERLDTVSLFSISDVVIGTGRVALEAMSCKRPVIAIGSKGVFGIVKPENFNVAWKYYFGDHRAKQTADTKRIERLIGAALRSKKTSAVWGDAGREFVKNKFHISGITDKLLAVYHKMV